MQIPYPILTTRLRKPEITDDLLARTRLIRKLNESISLPFTLISAGAGYGKSILASQWLDQVNCKYSWISCMEDMNSIKIFLAYLIKGITGTGTVKFKNTLALLEGPIEVPHKTLFHHFISELDLLKERLILIFDDFHYLRNSSIIDLIETLLKYPLPNFHICILTRRDPALNLYQYKLKHSMAEFRMKDLHFTRTEIKEYAKNQFNIVLSPLEVKELKEKTEGWILGLKGALMIYQKTESNDRLKQGLVAQEFKDLFFNEIIFKQDKVLQTALFISSLFERFCNPMLNFILKECYDNKLPSRKIIQEFARNNFFIISLDNQNEWYRFHHQFQVVLKEYLLEQVPDSDVIKFQKAGSSWLVNNGYYEEGIERAVNTEDSGFALDQFVKLKYNLLNSDQYNRLKYLLEIFPVSWQEKYPELVITKGLLLDIQGKYNAIPTILSHFEQLVEQKNIAEAEMREYLYLKGMTLYVSGKFHDSIKSFEKCIESDNADSEYIYTLAISYMAFALNNLKQKDKAFQIVTTYLDSLSNRKHFARGRIYAAKAFLYSYNGELNEAEKLVPLIIQSSSDQKHYITLSYGLYLKVMLCYSRNNYKDCIDTFENSYENRFRMQSSYFLRIWGIKALFHVKRNETALLDKTLREIDEFAFLVKDHGTDQLKKCFFTEIALQRGEIKKATDTSRNTSFSFYLPTLLFYIPQFTYLKLLLHLDNPESQKQYRLHKAKIEQFAQQTHHKIIDININLLNTLENIISGDENKAIEYLMNALEITSSENNIMIYSDYGDEIYELFEKLPEVIREQNHEKNILQLFQEIKTNRSNHGKPAVKPEMELSGRDIKILKMVSKGHKNIEIAQSMFLSPESIKKYMYEIFQKLQVNNRIKAVLKANELGLID